MVTYTMLSDKKHTDTLFKENIFTDQAGLTTRYYDTGSDKPALIFIHGGKRKSLRYYRQALEDLAQNYRIIAPEIPGYVNDFCPKDCLDLHDLAAFFNRLMESLKISSYYAAGHSMGGGVAILMSAENPRLLKVVASNSAGCPLHITRNRLLLALAYNGIRQGCSRQALKTIKKAYKSLKDIRRGRKGRTRYVLKSANRALNKNYSGLLKKANSPTLLIHAKRDNLFKKYSAQYLADLIPNTTLLEVKGFHDWPMHEQKRFAYVTERFLKMP